jgi:hypothetical protein
MPSPAYKAGWPCEWLKRYKLPPRSSLIYPPLALASSSSLPTRGKRKEVNASPPFPSLPPSPHRFDPPRSRPRIWGSLHVRSGLTANRSREFTDLELIGWCASELLARVTISFCCCFCLRFVWCWLFALPDVRQVRIRLGGAWSLALFWGKLSCYYCKPQLAWE